VHSGVDASGQRLSSKSGSGGGGERNGRVSSTDWQALSQGADTLVFLMAGKQLGGICRALVAEGGRPASTPACVVRDAGRGEAGAAADADAAVDAFSLLGSDTTTTRTAAKKEKSAQERRSPFPRSQRVWRGTLQTLESVVFGDEAGNGGVGGDGLAKETSADRKSGSVNGHTSSSSSPRSSSSPPLKPGESLSPAVLIIGPTAGVDLRSRRSDSRGESGSGSSSTSSSSSSSATTNTPAETSSSSPSSLSLPAASHPSELRTVSAVTSSGADEGGSSTGGGAGGSDGAGGGIGAYEVLLLDLDGVLWCGDEPIQGAAEAVRRFLLDGGGGGGSSSGGGDDAATRRGDHQQQDRVRCDRRVFFVTNNSAKTRTEYAAKLSKALGLSVTHDMVATSAWAAANYLSSSSSSKCEEVNNADEVARTSSSSSRSRRVAFVVGSAALVQELEEAGVECVTKASHGFGTSSVTTTTTTTSSSTASSNISSEKEGSGHVPPTTTTTTTTTTVMTPSALAAVELDARVDAVVVGWTNEFDYADLCLAAAYANAEHFRGDAPQSSSLATTVELIGTNPDVCNVLPTNTDDAARQRRRLLPENGCFLAAVEAATGRGAGSGGSGGGKTTVIAGKPRAFLAHALIDTHGLDPSKVLVVGDRLDTDVAFANAAGLASALVLTGVATADDAAKACMPEAPQKTRPRFVFDSLSAVIAAMEAPET